MPITVLHSSQVTYIIWDFGIILFAIDGEMKVPVALSCSSRNLTMQKHVLIIGQNKDHLSNVEEGCFAY